MCGELDNNLIPRLLAMIGQPYEKPDGCLRFVKRALWELGVKIEGTAESIKRDAKLFKPVDHGELGTVVIFDCAFMPLLSDEGYRFHIGMMLDGRWAMQSSQPTNGVARIEITRHPWVQGLRGFYRPRILDARCF
jgi:hypothetical protein